jgi:hypothetical protein
MNFRVKMLSIAAFCAGSMALCASAETTSADRLREDRCDVQARASHTLQTIPMRDLHVLEQTSHGGRFAPVLPFGTQAIICLRTSLTPAAHDDKVLALGFPLIIVEVGRRRVGALEVSEGAYHYRMMQGSLLEAEQAQVDARLTEFLARGHPSRAPAR